MNMLDQAKDKCSTMTGITEALLYTKAGEFASKKDIYQVKKDVYQVKAGRLPDERWTFTRVKRTFTW